MVSSCDSLVRVAVFDSAFVSGLVWSTIVLNIDNVLLRLLMISTMWDCFG